MKLNILSGHTSPETAYLVDDYPYGFRLRCSIRYWLEYAYNKGCRIVSQTSNPKLPGTVWNKPKASTYTAFAVLILDDQKHVSTATLNLYSTPAYIAEFRAACAGCLSASEQCALDNLEKNARLLNKPAWVAWDAAHHHLITS